MPCVRRVRHVVQYIESISLCSTPKIHKYTTYKALPNRVQNWPPFPLNLKLIHGPFGHNFSKIDAINGAAMHFKWQKYRRLLQQISAEYSELVFWPQCNPKHGPPCILIKNNRRFVHTLQPNTMHLCTTPIWLHTRDHINFTGVFFIVDHITQSTAY